jgi:hypothetical protein
VASVVVDYCLMGGSRVGKSRIVKVASFKGVAREKAAIGVPCCVVTNRSHPHKATGTGFVSCLLRRVGVHLFQKEGHPDKHPTVVEEV